MKSLKTLCAERQQIFMLNGSYSLFNSKGEGGVRKSNVANQGSLFERCGEFSCNKDPEQIGNISHEVIYN